VSAGIPALACVAVAVLVAVAGVARAAPEDGVRVSVQSPVSGSTVRARIDMAPLSGLAQADARPTSFEVMLVVDVSGSTKYPSGIDIDGDGLIGDTESSIVPGVPDTPNTDPGDSVLAAEALAGTQLLESLDPERIRVGVVSFSGEIDQVTAEAGPGPAARLEQRLTTDYDQVRRSLELVHLRGAHGGTDMQAGIKVALKELADSARPGSTSVILLLTDGKPSLPFGRADKTDKGDVEGVIAAARVARSGGVKINVFGLGRQAIDYPLAATEAARITGGQYIPVQRPGDIVTMLTGVSFANVEDVVAVNLTLGEMSAPDDILVQPDGSFRGFVPVRPGRNRIRVSALSSDGRRGSTEFEITFMHQDMTDAELQLELERIRRRSRELQLMMEKKRQDAFRDSERKRALKVETEKEDQP